MVTGMVQGKSRREGKKREGGGEILAAWQALFAHLCAHERDKSKERESERESEREREREGVGGRARNKRERMSQ